MDGIAPKYSTLKILFKEGDWTIEKLETIPDSPGFKSARSKYYSLVKHICFPDLKKDANGVIISDGSSVHQVVVYPDDSSRCWRCTTPIPEGVQALWKFQNWEQLEYGG